MVVKYFKGVVRIFGAVCAILRQAQTCGQKFVNADAAFVSGKESITEQTLHRRYRASSERNAEAAQTCDARAAIGLLSSCLASAFGSHLVGRRR